MLRSEKDKLLVLSSVSVTLIAAALGGRLLFTPRGDDAGPEVSTLSGHPFPIQAVAFSHDGTRMTAANYYLGLAADEIDVTDWDVTTGQRTGQRTVALGTFRSVAFATGGRLLASPGTSHGVWLWDRDRAQPRQLLHESSSLVRALAVSEDGSLLATANDASDDAHDIVVWDVASGQPTARCRGHVQAVLALAVAPDGKTLASGGADNTLRLWNTVTGEQRGVLRKHTNFIIAVAFAPDGRMLGSVDRDGVAVLWDVGTQTERATLATAHERGTIAPDVRDITAATFSPDSRLLAVAVERTVQLWDTATGACLTRLMGHDGEVKCLAFSPDGTRLASGGHDRTVRLWDVTRFRVSRP